MQPEESIYQGCGGGPACLDDNEANAGDVFHVMSRVSGEAAEDFATEVDSRPV